MSEKRFLVRFVGLPGGSNGRLQTFLFAATRLVAIVLVLLLELVKFLYLARSQKIIVMIEELLD